MPCRKDTKHGLNFVFLADEAFALHENIMKPYPQRQLTKEKRIFNYRLSRARRTVENAFGILSNRFRIFLTPINLQVEKIDWVVTASCVLHNYLRHKATQLRTLVTSTLQDTNQPEETGQLSSVEATLFSSRTTARAKEVREEYLTFFNGVGAVPWQHNI